MPPPGPLGPLPLVPGSMTRLCLSFLPLLEDNVRLSFQLCTFRWSLSLCNGFKRQRKVKEPSCPLQACCLCRRILTPRVRV